MKKWLKKILKVLSISLLSLFLLIFLYLLIALICTIIPVNKNFKQAENGTEIFVSSNKVHTFIIVPVQTSEFDWFTFVKPEYFKEDITDCNYISFGWGDKEFYTTTPYWSDLKFKTAFKAIFYDDAALDVCFLKFEPQIGKFTKKIKISDEQFSILISYLKSSFEVDENNKLIFVPNDFYSDKEAFFEARENYSMFKTCNNWTNRGLKQCGIKNSLWTPFAFSVMFFLD